VKLIAFTGSGDVGWKLQERAPRKRVKLELGNSTPVIVAGDADVDGCVEAGFERLLVRRAELHLGPAHLRAAVAVRRLSGFVRPEGAGAESR
jgi:hypothetical protein